MAMDLPDVPVPQSQQRQELDLPDVAVPQTRQREPKPEHVGPLTAREDETAGQAITKGTTTALLKGLSHIPGFLGDLGQFADYAASGIQSLMSDKTQAQIMQEEAEKRKKDPSFWRTPLAYFPTGEDVYNALLAPKLGEYKPDSVVGKSLMGAAETATSLLGPGGILGAGSRAAAKAPTAAAAAAARKAATIEGLGVGALSGGLGTAATELSGSPELGLIAGLAVPVAAAGRAYKSNPTRLARSELTAAMQTPKETTAAILAGGERSPIGAPRTTAMTVNDPGLARMQHDLSSSSRATSEFAGDLAHINKQRNETIIDALRRSAAPDADPMAVQTAMNSERTNLANQLRAAESSAPRDVDPIVAAQRVRENVDRVWDNYAERTAELYRAIDPSNTASANIGRLKNAVGEIERRHNPDIHGPMDPALTEITGMINRLPDQIPFLDAVELDKTMERFRRAAAMRPEGGLAARQIGGFKDAINLDMGSATGFSGTVNPATALRAAKDHYIAGKDLFENQYVGGAMRQKNYGQYAMTDKSAVNAIFPSGPSGGHSLEAWLNTTARDPAARDAVLDGIETIATASLGSKELTPAALAAWQAKYGPALTVLERERPGFMSRFGDVAAARDAVNNLQTGIAGTILNASDPSQISAKVGQMVRDRAAGPAQWGEILNRIPDPTARAQAEQGMRRAGVNFIESAFHDPDLGNISGARLRSFLNQNEANLRGLYGADYNNMRQIAEELARAQKVAEVGKTPVGSNTGYNTRAQVQRRIAEDPTVLSMFVSGAVGHMAFPMVGMAAGPAAWMFQRFRNHSAAQRQAVVDQLVRDALLDPQKAKVLLSKPTMENVRALDPYLAVGRTTSEIVLGQDAANERWTNPDAPVTTTGPNYLPSLIGKAGQLMPGFKRGGAVRSIDHGKKADALISAAEKAKKGHNSTTEPLLNQPDEAITKALAIANEAI